MSWMRLRRWLERLLPIPLEAPPPAKDITDAEDRQSQIIARLDALGVQVDLLEDRVERLNGYHGHN